MVYLVIGFMRSGTAMMMQTLRAGGMDIVYDADMDVELMATLPGANPLGFFEGGRPEDGKAWKLPVCMAQQLSPVPPENGPYKAVRITRAVGNVIASLGKMGKSTTYFTAKRVNDLRNDFDILLFQRPDIEIVDVTYEEILISRGQAVNALTRLTDAGWPLNASIAVDAIRSDLQREFGRVEDADHG